MDIFLGRQSILDKNKQIVAYELLFRSSNSTSIKSDTEATANVICNTLSGMPINYVIENKKGFINIGIDILQKGLLDILPPNRFTIEILETEKPTVELVTLVKQLKKKGYSFALDDFILNKEQLEYWKPILSEVDIVKVDVLDTNRDDLIQNTPLLKKYNIQLLAEKIETEEMFHTCYSLGYDMYQGYFFTKPDLLKGKNISPSVQGILSIIKLLQQDADITEIQQTLKLHPQLIISLLKIVNSSSVSPIQEITSIQQAIALLGKKAFMQWILLLLYSQKSQCSEHYHIKDDPLFLMATQRGKMMENIVTHVKPKISKSMKDTAFLTGLISLSDALLNTPIQEITTELNLSSEIADAIINYNGELGTYLKLSKAIENNDAIQIKSIALSLNLSSTVINNILFTAIKFSKDLANQF